MTYFLLGVGSRVGFKVGDAPSVLALAMKPRNRQSPLFAKPKNMICNGWVAAVFWVWSGELTGTSGGKRQSKEK